MIDSSKLSKLTVGDLASYERWRREERKKELIETTKELYGDNVPDNAVSTIEAELKKIPNLMDADGFDLNAAQYLFWVSMKKADPDITMAQVGNLLESDKLEEYSNVLFPQPKKLPAKKKQVRKKKKKDN